MSVQQAKASESVAWFGNRNFIVPPDITAVSRVTPLPKKKRTAWRPRPEGEVICRAGQREWFSDRLFADGHVTDLRTTCGTSTIVHACCLVGFLVLLAGQPAPTEPPVRVSEPLRMPAFVATLAASAGGGGHLASGPRLTPTAEGRPVVPAPKERPREIAASKARVAAPPEPVVQTLPHSVPLQVATETRKPEFSGDVDSIARQDVPASATDVSSGSGAGGDSVPSGTGVGNGSGGSAGGSTDGTGGKTAGIAMSPGPYRLGKGIEPPRKIKEVRPLYPSDAMTLRALGTVAIEAVVGADGLVHDAKVIHSIPLLDQAALDAVRQWQFTPARLNGAAVAVIITVLVQFSIH